MRVLFLDSVHPILEERLLAYGFTCVHDYTSPSGKIRKVIGDYTGVVIRGRLPFDAEMIASAKNLKFIARSGAGLENIDLAAAKKAGITVLNSPEGNRDAVGEHAIGMLLMLFNQLKKGDTEGRAGIWDREGNRGLELAGKTVGIIGYGHMGAAFAKKLSGFDCKILAYDKYKSGFGTDLVSELSLETLQENADIISIHLPLSAETDYYVDEAFIEKCKKPFYLINTARGRHVKIAALLDGLSTGKVLGACLDVLEFELKSFEKLELESLPESFQMLAQNTRVVLSPHVAGWTVESHVKLADFLADKILGLELK
jgi:D-3-phosphoglycerate dehydrogenase